VPLDGLDVVRRDSTAADEREPDLSIGNEWLAAEKRISQRPKREEKTARV
jgi:hypothetical protein